MLRKFHQPSSSSSDDDEAVHAAHKRRAASSLSSSLTLSISDHHGEEDDLGRRRGSGCAAAPRASLHSQLKALPSASTEEDSDADAVVNAAAVIAESNTKAPQSQWGGEESADVDEKARHDTSSSSSSSTMLSFNRAEGVAPAEAAADDAVSNTYPVSSSSSPVMAKAVVSVVAVMDYADNNATGESSSTYQIMSARTQESIAGLDCNTNVNKDNKIGNFKSHTPPLVSSSSSPQQTGTAAAAPHDVSNGQFSYNRIGVQSSLPSAVTTEAVNGGDSAVLQPTSIVETPSGDGAGASSCGGNNQGPPSRVVLTMGTISSGSTGASCGVDNTNKAIPQQQQQKEHQSSALDDGSSSSSGVVVVAATADYRSAIAQCLLARALVGDDNDYYDDYNGHDGNMRSDTVGISDWLLGDTRVQGEKGSPGVSLPIITGGTSRRTDDGGNDNCVLVAPSRCTIRNDAHMDLAAVYTPSSSSAPFRFSSNGRTPSTVAPRLTVQQPEPQHQQSAVISATGGDVSTLSAGHNRVCQW